jgi:hypothetical protein
MTSPLCQVLWKSTSSSKDVHRSFMPKVMVTSLLLCHFCPTAHYMPCLPPLHQLKTVCDVTMVTQQCKQSQTTAEQGWKSCIQLTDLNLNHFKMAEAMGWNITASTSLWMASPPPPHQISWKSTKWFKRWYGRQTGWWSHKPISIFGK